METLKLTDGYLNRTVELLHQEDSKIDAKLQNKVAAGLLLFFLRLFYFNSDLQIECTLYIYIHTHNYIYIYNYVYGK